jgi:hypothetical protein
MELVFQTMVSTVFVLEVEFLLRPRSLLQLPQQWLPFPVHMLQLLPFHRLHMALQLLVTIILLQPIHFNTQHHLLPFLPTSLATHPPPLLMYRRLQHPHIRRHPHTFLPLPHPCPQLQPQLLGTIILFPKILSSSREVIVIREASMHLPLIIVVLLHPTRVMITMKTTQTVQK